MEIVLLVIGLVVGGVCAWFIQQYRLSSQQNISPKQLEELQNKLHQSQIECARNEQITHDLSEKDHKAQTELARNRQEITHLKEAFVKEQTERQASQRRLQEQKQEFEKNKEQLKADFQNLANAILEDKSKKFTDLNQKNIGDLLKPLDDKIKDFKDRLEKTHETQVKDRSELREQIRNLAELNVQMSKEANDLTSALKGSNKTMGDWGEMILEKLLEASGLQKDREYSVQESFTTEGGQLRPDIVINLPGNKHLVVDSKVSLVDYEKYCSCSEEDGDAEKHLKAHIGSIQKHIKDLSQKNYQHLYQISSPDFVMMFIPIDSAFFTAVEKRHELFMEAFEKGVFMVTPTTLLLALRMVANLWSREKQDQNALEIARRGGLLYDKFVGFYDQLEDLGRHIDRTHQCYEGSLNKLKDGRGSLVTQVEMIRKLGAKASKSLPQDVVEQAEESMLTGDADLQ